MNKVICDVCGTTYPNTAQQCPICGFANDEVGEEVWEDAYPEEKYHAHSTRRVKGGRFSASNVRRRNQDSLSYQIQEPEEEEDDFEKEYPEPESNAILVALLVIVIAALLVVTGIIFFRYYLPNNLSEETTVPTQMEDTEPSEESTVPTVPCTSLALISGGSVELTQEGYKHLLNVVVVPSDTTDTIAYSSSDETVATVNEEGRVTAVGEGEAVITVTCGSQSIICTVICDFTPEETTEATEATEATVETTQPLLDIDLWVNKTDMTLFHRGEQVILKFNQELTAEQITWTVDNSAVATVENGVITAVGGGTTNVRATYGDQEIVIIVRCAFS